ncbi:Glucan endo-1,3-beta-glucosidase-like protein 1 [Apostasia shenzhenica]|uniref:Glucan endo-1,3-beta-glucosidase-like protein 1 n=1 Tax=Apostasia shenzhenica TaxID=1088818 RepID=A0A2I0A7X1_9ASPA|nr:Glucan endo-1,3-beta-glucosidase-like protein 1 [Apostasia shenzhenica]
MAKLRRRSLLLLLLLLLLPLGFPAAGDSVSRKDGGAGVVAGGELWCVAKNNAEDAVLQAGLDWACGPGRSDCGPVQPGGPCFEPDDLQSHASYAFNDYFLRHGSSQPACDFSGAAALTLLNPS